MESPKALAIINLAEITVINVPVTLLLYWLYCTPRALTPGPDVPGARGGPVQVSLGGAVRGVGGLVVLLGTG